MWSWSYFRPRESASEDFVNRLLVLFGYPDRSAAALLAGVLPLRYCSARFACELPTWRLPDRGHVCDSCGSGPGFFAWATWNFGIRNGLLCLQLPSVLMTLLIGPTLLVFWLNGLPFLGLCIGLLEVQTLGLVVSLTLNCLFFLSFGAGERLSLEEAHPRYLRAGRQISVSAVPFVPGIDIWRSCRFIGALMRSLCLLPGGLGRFVPCSIGASHCRLRHIGWERCGHGLASRPRESASEPFLNELLGLFRYPPGSGRALLAGTLPLRYCTTRFACSSPTWRLPESGHVAGLVTAVAGVESEVVDCADDAVSWVHGSGSGRSTPCGF